MAITPLTRPADTFSMNLETGDGPFQTNLETGDGPLTPSLSPSKGERVPSRLVSGRFRGSMRECSIGRILHPSAGERDGTKGDLEQNKRTLV